ncbi:hypothetical protein WL30_29640 [Burkholderia ubonensis]|uniref:hypothetical protein n=1 Tax=Burkholderia ubonensis TaxID=101571 RepID=UPI0007532032|nr:hypothetical protein [Burkholderia ubonensis]KVT87490.1 hypothetical protein WK59_08210 [Burkholderia ubonensis]KWA80396.1 hypothetical protein WL30_29640 [Burkholderia ubonensis]KWB13945.1 hypothetical protein WL31_17090 [Burkholderia ubonensis]
MALQLIKPHDKYLLKVGVIHHGAVIGHLHQVLKTFAAKPEYSKFYIGITSDLNKRLSSHQAKKPFFKLMCPIYEEPHNLVGNAFDRLEREAITNFRAGIKHPETGELALKCDNGPDGALPKNWLYILVG